jgi:hypothetical protein
MELRFEYTVEILMTQSLGEVTDLKQFKRVLDSWTVSEFK